jgi:hypothetical protein
MDLVFREEARAEDVFERARSLLIVAHAPTKRDETKITSMAIAKSYQ